MRDLPLIPLCREVGFPHLSIYQGACCTNLLRKLNKTIYRDRSLHDHTSLCVIFNSSKETLLQVCGKVSFRQKTQQGTFSLIL